MIKNKKQSGQSLGILAYLGVFLIFYAWVVVWQPTSANAAISSDLARWYYSDEAIGEHEIVSIQSQKADYVAKASTGGEVTLLGVSVPEGDSTLSVDKKEGGIQVALAGRSEVKVNDDNGAISRGDLIGLSETPGIGAKAKAGAPVIGVAEASYDPANTSLGETILPIVISVGVAPLSISSEGSATMRTWLTSFAGNDVSAMQLAFVFFIAIIGLVTIVTLTYSSARNGVVAVGRNPLAKQSIFGALSQVMIMVSIVAISCFSLIYFLLRL